jgi:hypothetical protein
LGLVTALFGLQSPAFNDNPILEVEDIIAKAPFLNAGNVRTMVTRAP